MVGMPHAIYIVKRDGNGLHPQELLAYDIDRVSLANRLIRGIAKSNPLNGFSCMTGWRWFHKDGAVFYIYRTEMSI